MTNVDKALVFTILQNVELFQDQALLVIKAASRICGSRGALSRKINVPESSIRFAEGSKNVSSLHKILLKIYNEEIFK